MAVDPDKDDIRYCVISFLCMGAKPPYAEVEKIVKEAHIHSLFINMRNIFHDIKTQHLARLMHLHKIKSLNDFSSRELSILLEGINYALQKHDVFPKHFRKFRERVKGHFNINVDVFYAIGIEKTVKGNEIVSGFSIIYANGFNLFSSSENFFKKLEEYFSRFNPPLMFLNEPPSLNE